MARSKVFAISLLLIFGAGLLALFLSHSISEFGAVPLKRGFGIHEATGWEDEIELGALDTFDPEKVSSIEDDATQIVFPDRYAETESEYEIIHAEDSGEFEGSWISGKVVAAALVAPAFNEEGSLSEWRYPELHRIDGSKFPEPEYKALVDELVRSGVESDSEGTLRIYNYPETYPVPEAMVVGKVTQIDGDGYLVDSFDCYNEDTGFSSHSSHRGKAGPYLLGNAEFFAWHSASLRCRWDLTRDGGIRNLPMEFEEGVVKRWGQLTIKALKRKAGAFDAGVAAVGKDEPVLKFTRVEGEAAVHTCFFASNLPARTFRFVEISEGEGAWRRMEAGMDEGLGWFHIPAETKSFRWRVLYYPLPVRVVAKIPVIGGAPDYNGEATDFGNLQFSLGKMELNNSSLSFFLWQLMGSGIDYPSTFYNHGNREFSWSDPDQLYTADDLLSIWRKLNPNQSINFDAATVTFIIEDKVGLIERLQSWGSRIF